MTLFPITNFKFSFYSTFPTSVNNYFRTLNVFTIVVLRLMRCLTLIQTKSTVFIK